MSEACRLRRDERCGACDDESHADNEFNNRCDQLAVAESQKFKPVPQPNETTENPDEV